MNQSPNLPDQLLKAGDVAQVLNISRASAYRLMINELPSIRIGAGTVRVKPADLAAYIERKTIQHEPDGRCDLTPAPRGVG